MKMLKFVLLMALAQLIVGCQTVITPTPVVKTSSTLASIDRTPLPAATSTPTPTPTATPLPTKTPFPVSTPLAVSSLTEKGRILVWSNASGNYMAIDLDTGMTSTIRWNSNCEWRLLPNATVAVCENAAGQFYLRDFTGGLHKTSVSDAEMIGWSPNGQFVLFGRKAPNADYRSVFTYDIAKDVTDTLAINITRQEQERWLERPVLSADGREIFVVQATDDQQSASVFEIGKNARQVGLYKPRAAWAIALSPLTNDLVYGATDIEQEIGPSPNYLYLVNTQSGKIKQLAKSPDFRFFWSRSLEWSPTGKEIAVGLWDLAFESDPQTCMIDVSTTAQVCLTAKPGRFMAWSPGGEHIAFVNLHNSLVVSKPDGSEAVELLHNVDDEFILMWR